MTNILVPEAQTRAGVAVIRTLGRAGYHVHACSYKKDALGLKSNYATRKVLQPPYDSPDYLAWLKEYIAQNDIKMIVPSSNILAAVRPRFDDFKHLLPVNHDPEKLFKFKAKTNIVDSYIKAPKELGLLDHHPSSNIVDLKKDGAVKIPEETPFGFYIKFEDRLAPPSPEGDAPDLHYVKSADDVRKIIHQARGIWGKALIQSGCTGRQVGVSLLMDRGEVLAVSCVRDKYEKPHSRGTMSLREYFWNEDIVQDAIKRLRYLEWQGCAMVEYRCENNGDFKVIEINARYWQYLHLDIKSGVDFPKYQAEWFLDGKRKFDYQAKAGTVSRDTWPGEVAGLVNELRDQSKNPLNQVKAVGGFFYRFLVYDDDFNFPGDRKLYFHNFLSYLKSEIQSLAS